MVILEMVGFVLVGVTASAMLLSQKPISISSPMQKYLTYNSLDIDECSQSVNNCHQNSNCINIDGSFLCTCGSGYSGNGTVCQGKYNEIKVYLFQNPSMSVKIDKLCQNIDRCVSCPVPSACYLDVYRGYVFFFLHPMSVCPKLWKQDLMCNH
jgi:hypothetical protein